MIYVGNHYKVNEFQKPHTIVSDDYHYPFGYSVSKIDIKLKKNKNHPKGFEVTGGFIYNQCSDSYMDSFFSLMLMPYREKPVVNQYLTEVLSPKFYQFLKENLNEYDIEYLKKYTPQNSVIIRIDNIFEKKHPKTGQLNLRPDHELYIATEKNGNEVKFDAPINTIKIAKEIIDFLVNKPIEFDDFKEEGDFTNRDYNYLNILCDDKYGLGNFCVDFEFYPEKLASLRDKVGDDNFDKIKDIIKKIHKNIIQSKISHKYRSNNLDLNKKKHVTYIRLDENGNFTRKGINSMMDVLQVQYPNNKAMPKWFNEKSTNDGLVFNFSNAYDIFDALCGMTQGLFCVDFYVFYYKKLFQEEHNLGMRPTYNTLCRRFKSYFREHCQSHNLDYHESIANATVFEFVIKDLLKDIDLIDLIKNRQMELNNPAHKESLDGFYRTKNNIFYGIEKWLTFKKPARLDRGEDARAYNSHNIELIGDHIINYALEYYMACIYQIRSRKIMDDRTIEDFLAWHDMNVIRPPIMNEFLYLVLDYDKDVTRRSYKMLKAESFQNGGQDDNERFIYTLKSREDDFISERFNAFSEYVNRGNSLYLDSKPKYTMPFACSVDSIQRLTQKTFEEWIIIN